MRLRKSLPVSHDEKFGKVRKTVTQEYLKIHLIREYLNRIHIIFQGGIAQSLGPLLGSRGYVELAGK